MRGWFTINSLKMGTAYGAVKWGVVMPSGPNRYLPREEGFSWMNDKRYCWRYLFRISDCPSVWGWYAELIRDLVPCNSNKVFQNRLIKIGSLSDMLLGNMWRLQTILVKRSVALLAENWEGNISKWAYSQKRSITTIITVFPWYAGKFAIKSITMSSQMKEGSRIDCGRPAGDFGKYLHCLQI